MRGTNYYEAYTGIELPLKKHLSQLIPGIPRAAAARQLVAAGCCARDQLLRSLYRHRIAAEEAGLHGHPGAGGCGGELGPAAVR